MTRVPIHHTHSQPQLTRTRPHVQLLRYLFHVIIPGEKQICALWSTLQPAQDFAKWSKQREIRHISYQLAILLRKQTGI